MKRLLIKQGFLLPFIYFGVVIIASLFAKDYSHIGQHASELAINSNKTAVSIFNTGVIITGLLLILFGLGLILNPVGKLFITGTLIMIFGITFLFGGIFPIGSPLHGLYGLGMSMIITPFSFLYEADEKFKSKKIRFITVISGLIIFIYLWSMIAGLDPRDYRGITQRIFGVVTFGWISYIAYSLNNFVKNRELN